MRRTLFHGSRRFEIVLGLERHAFATGEALVAPGRALGLLQEIAGDAANVARLRRLLADATAEGALPRLDDAAVLARVAAELRAGRATLVEHPADNLASFLGDGAAEEEAAPMSARAPRAERTWIEIVLIGEDDKPIPGEAYRVELPDGSVREGSLDDKGFARCDGIDPGTCQVTFPRLDEEAWTRA